MTLSSVVSLGSDVFKFLPMTEAHASEILSWRYEHPYEVYNPDENRLSEDISYFINPINKMFSIQNKLGDLVGFCSFGEDGQVPGGDYSIDALDIGLGIHPSLTGKGLGNIHLAAALIFGKNTFDPKNFRATIADFNHRAQNLCVNAGFEYLSSFTNTSGTKKFMIFIRDLQGMEALWQID